MLWVIILMLIWMCYEATSYIHYLLLKRVVDKEKEYEEQVDMEEYILEMDTQALKELIEKSISYSFSDEKSYYVRVPYEEMPREKMLKWTAYNTYLKPMRKLKEIEKERVREILGKIEEKIGYRFNEIENDKIYFFKFGGNKLETLYRPTIVNGIFTIIKYYTYRILESNGFKKYEVNGMTYLYYKGEDGRRTTIFLHGLGMVTQYVNYLLELKKVSDIIVPIMPNISNMEFTSMISMMTLSGVMEDKIFPSYDQLKKNIKTVIDNNEIEKIDVVAHSFGTVILGIILKEPELKEYIEKRVLIDPVCFKDKYYKVYRYINEQKNEKGVIASILNLLIYKDIYVRYVIQRYLYGPLYWIEMEELNRTDDLIVLSERDKIVPTDVLQKKCERYGIEYINILGSGHSDIFVMAKYKENLTMITKFLSRNK